MADWVAALDGGGTKTAAALADRRGGVTFLPRAAGCNPQDGPGWDTVLGGVLAGLARARPVAAVLGLPGWGEVADHDAAVAAMIDRLLPGAEPLNDVTLAFHGAFPAGCGVLILAGTGAMAMAANGGPVVRVGGWGDQIGDEGSAHWIGVAALRQAAQQIDRRQPDTGWAGRLMAALGQPPTPFAPLDFVQGAGRAAIAGVARHVDALAIAGDAVAQGILADAAAELAHAAIAAMRQCSASGLDWAPAGSAFRSVRLRDGVSLVLGRRPVAAAMDALSGGLHRAAQAAGWRPDAEWNARVRAACQAWAG